MTLSVTINETLKRLSSLPIFMQESFWWRQSSGRYIISHPPCKPGGFCGCEAPCLLTSHPDCMTAGQQSCCVNTRRHGQAVTKVRSTRQGAEHQSTEWNTKIRSTRNGTPKYGAEHQSTEWNTKVRSTRHGTEHQSRERNTTVRSGTEHQSTEHQSTERNTKVGSGTQKYGALGTERNTKVRSGTTKYGALGMERNCVCSLLWCQRHFIRRGRLFSFYKYELYYS